ncbi:MAG: transglutaminase family protein [Acidimicrobiales bacterium]
MRLDIRYQMRFSYEVPVREAHNEVRVRPRDLLSQRLLGHRLTTTPAARILSFTDYWGTTVEHFGHVADHQELDIVAETAVETRVHAYVENASISAVDAAEFIAANVEYLRPSPHVAWDDDLAHVSRDCISGFDDVHSVVDAIVANTRNQLSYERGTTHIGISLHELVSQGTGVCQDFAHLTIGSLRSVGIPSRYVSGYLFAADESALDDLDADDSYGEVVTVQTHAWVEAAVPGSGWLAIDPTNNQPVGERHVVVGHGRDYEDVAPVRGVYQGEATPEVESTVEIRRMEQVERAMTERPRRRPVQHATVPVDVEAAVAQQQQQQ